MLFDMKATFYLTLLFNLGKPPGQPNWFHFDESDVFSQNLCISFEILFSILPTNPFFCLKKKQLLQKITLGQVVLYSKI